MYKLLESRIFVIKTIIDSFILYNQVNLNRIQKTLNKVEKDYLSANRKKIKRYTKDKNLQILIPFYFTIFLSKKLYKSTIFLKILSKVHLKISIDQTFSTNKSVLICTIQVSLNYLKKNVMSRGLYVREEKEERSFSIGTRTAISRNSVNRFQLEESGETRNDIYKISASQRVSSPPSLLLDSGNLMNPRERLDVPSTRRNFDLYGGSLWRIVSIAGQVRENSSSRGIWKV